MHFFSWPHRACQMNISISVKPIFINSSGIENLLISVSNKLKRIVRWKFPAPLLTPPNFINSSNYRFLRLKLCLNYFLDFFRVEMLSESSWKRQKAIPIVPMQNYTIIYRFYSSKLSTVQICTIRLPCIRSLPTPKS